jgi:NAD-dependent SIR2 family protein deacetylase
VRFIDEGPDLPEPLLRAQRAGDVMFVVGAGVSKNAGLPLFGELADRIYTRIGQGVPGTEHSIATAAELDARADKQYDRLLGLLERRVVFRRADWHQPTNIVRAAALTELKPRRGGDLSVHRDLLISRVDWTARPAW